MSNLIAVTIGDINGIGIELLIRLYKKDIYKFVLFTDKSLFTKYILDKKLKFKINIVNNDKKISFRKGFFNIYSFKSMNNVENTYNSLINAHRECKKKSFIGMITLPLRKDLIIRKIDKKFIGHTEFLQKIENKNNSNMILYHQKIIVSTLTTHIQLKSIFKYLKKENYIYKKIIDLNNALKKDFNFINPKILISGINPHAGENGMLGNEEDKILSPVVNKLRLNGVNITGPISGDAMLIKNNINKYNCFLFIYHDQALIPYKIISNFTGVNYTGNLDIIRTSPDHGTAYNLVGRNKGSALSLKNCFNLIYKINKNRKKHVKTKKISSSKFYQR